MTEQQNLQTYFNQTEGIGVLATANQQGEVDAAVYARPHIMTDGNLAFIMRNRLTHANLAANPHAAYLFIEKGSGYHGRRLLLTKIGENQDPDLIREVCRRCYLPKPGDPGNERFVVVFRIDKELPLIGSGD